VSDDGRGLDRERILAKAIERGLVKVGQVPGDDEILQLIFLPGFSTAAQVTDISGRGVGMDVVKRNVEALRGQIGISSRPGCGTSVQIRLPLTLAIIDGFLVTVGQAHYIVPLELVVECIEVPAEADDGDERVSRYVNLRGEVLPFIALSGLFGIEPAVAARRSLVVVKYGPAKVGILVDRLMGEYQTVIKPLGRLFAGLKGIAGSTILGSGEVALILDIPALVAQAAAQPVYKAHAPLAVHGGAEA
jgi:two-component system chemotaxis sensor kinase CheA